MLVRPSACTFHNNCLRFVTVDFDSHTGTNTAIASYILDRCNEHTLLEDAILKAPVLTDLRNAAVPVTHGSQALCVFPASPPALPPLPPKARQRARMKMTEPHRPLRRSCKAVH